MFQRTHTRHSLSLSLSLVHVRTLSDSFYIQMFSRFATFFFFRCYTGYTGFHNLIVQLFINETYKINIAHIILFISRVYNNLIFQQIFLGRLLILFTRDLQSFG